MATNNILDDEALQPEIEIEDFNVKLVFNFFKVALAMNSFDQAFHLIKDKAANSENAFLEHAIRQNLEGMAEDLGEEYESEMLKNFGPKFEPVATQLKWLTFMKVFDFKKARK